MVHILARISARADAAAAMRDILVRLRARTVEEPGCRAYALYQQADDPAQFQTVEEWADAAAADAHMRTPHVAQAVAEGGALFAAAPQILRYEKLA